MERICIIEGCTNLGSPRQTIDGKVIRRSLCGKHHREKHPRTPRWWRHKDNFNKCSICSWIGPCDMHRIIEQGKYIRENVISVCPNCHRLHHGGIGIIDKSLIK